MTFVDLDWQIIPDDVSITGSALAVLPPLFFASVPVHPTSPAWLESLLTQLNQNAAGTDPGWIGYGVGAVVCGAAAAYLFRRYSRDFEGAVRKWWETRLAFAVGAALGAFPSALCPSQPPTRRTNRGAEAEAQAGGTPSAVAASPRSRSNESSCVGTPSAWRGS